VCPCSSGPWQRNSWKSAQNKGDKYTVPGKLTILLHQISPSAAEVLIGEHRVTVDRPAALGGSNMGPMGGELFLAAVGGCFMSNLLAAIRARESGVRNVHIEVSGTVMASPARFSSVDLAITAEAADREELVHLSEIADRGCIMMNTLRDKLTLNIAVATAV
jgi:putative redox protein